jgi:hypothetical protein
MLDRLGVQAFPMIGTIAWCDLADDDPVKQAAVLDAAQHWALRLETCQEAKRHASQAISKAANWTVIGRYLRDRAAFLKRNPWARRVIV